MSRPPRDPGSKPPRPGVGERIIARRLRTPPRVLRYAVGVGVPVAAAAAYAVLQPILAPRIFLLLTPAVVLSAWYGGFGPAVVSSFLAVWLANFFFYPPVGRLALNLDADAIELMIFLGVGLLVSSTMESLRRGWAAAERAEERQALLLDVGTTLSVSSGFSQAFQDLADLLVRSIADYAVTYVLAENGVVERAGVAHADPEKRALVHRLLDIDPPSRDSRWGAGAVIRTGEPVLAIDVSEDLLERAAQNEAHLAVLRELHPISSVIVPMRTRGRVIGAIALATTGESGRHYGAGELGLAEAIASRAALVLDNERRREEADEARERAERAERRARESEEAGRILASSLDYEQTLERVARLAVRALGDIGVVDLVEKDGTLRRVAATHRDPARQELAERLKGWPPDPKREEGVPRALRSREPIIANDVPPELLERAAQSAEHLEVIRALDARAFLIVPLTLRGETLGAITVASSDPAIRYGDDDLLFARKLADRAAVAIDNARLFRETQAAVKLREDVLAIVSHDLRNLVGNLQTTTQVLLEFDLPEGKRRDLLERELRVIGEADRLIGDLLDVSRAEAGRLTLDRRPISPADLVRDALSAFGEKARRAGIELRSSTPDDLPRIDVDRDRTIRVLYNLLSNAINHTPGGGVIQALGEVEPSGGVRFRVVDSGPGIPEEERPHLFDPFWRSGRAGRDGVGLGLAIAKSLVEAHGGRIWLETAGDEGSTFCFTMPTVRVSEPPVSASRGSDD